MNDELCQLLYSFVRAHEISRRKFHLLQPAVLVTGPKRIGKVRGVLRIAGLLDLPVVVKTGTALYGETAGAIENRVDRAFLEANDRFYPNVGILLMTDINRFGYLEGTLNTRAILALKRNLTSSAPGDRSSIITIGTSSTSSAELSSSLIRLFPHEIKLTGLADAEAKLQELLSQSLCPSVASSKTVVDGEIMRNVNNLSVSSLEDLCIRYDVASTQSPDGDAEERFQSCVKSWLQEQGIKAKVSDLSWADVGGLANAKQEILDTIQFPLKHPEFARSGLRRGGALMHGPPGCGKTLLARAVAAQCSLGFISVKGPELINMYVGQSEANVRAVFEKARSVAPCVIFFDEVDSLAPARGRTGDSGGVLDRIVSQFLAELDALNDVSEAEDNGDQSKVVFALAATNRPDLVDPSFLRPGRFDRLVYVGPPETKDQRIQILKAASRSLPLAPDVDFTELESNCPTEATGAVLSSIIKRAAHSAIRRSIQTGLPPEQMKIDMQDFKSVLF
ncbi:unnamed protein product [Cyprideis torosa]|uniref:Peroxisomal ATPase PEX6 n=1 Tax=Cyprideis torosa TaxID=163714 RepID=A0A7R8WKV9_9CRUS|nr:unnamed protein product [Cyprideis torosa]CAG0900893.1 unnamed protein product [Cyprideis torosa]